METVAAEDEQLLEQYLDAGELSPDQLRAGIRKATLAGTLVPVLCGASLRNRGVQLLLDAVVHYLPSPLDVPPIVGRDPNHDTPISRRADDSEPFTALAFKIAADPNVDKVVYIRIYSGVLKTQSVVWNPRTESRERVTRILRVHASRREVVDEARTGDIVVLIGPRNTATGDTLCTREAPIVLESMTFPDPVVFMAIEPKSDRDKDQLEFALRIIQDEDPTVEVHEDPDTGQRILSGMGELHLEILVDRMRREFNVEARVGRPQVAYKETVSATAEATGRYARQAGEESVFAEVTVEVSPMARGAGVQLVDKIAEGALPSAVRAAVSAGANSSLNSGVVSGFPLTDVQVVLKGANTQDKSSSEMAFEAAAAMSVHQAMQKASPVLLEPIMKAQFVTPSEFLGRVLGDLNARRVQIQGVESRSTDEVINAQVPLAEMFEYTTTLRSLTQGRGTHILEFSHYAQAPPRTHD